MQFCLKEKKSFGFKSWSFKKYTLKKKKKIITSLFRLMVDCKILQQIVKTKM